MLTIETTAVTRGALLAAGCIKLNSWFEGDITCSRLEIGRDGYVQGKIVTRELWVEGQVVGEINAGIVHLLDGAFVEGDVHHHVLSLHETATLMGRSLRTTQLPFPQALLALETSSGVTAAGRFPVSLANETNGVAATG